MVLPKNTGSVLRTEMEGHSNQPSVTAVPRNPIPSSDLHSHQAHACVHACMQANTQTHKSKSIKRKFKLGHSFLLSDYLTTKINP